MPQEFNTQNTQFEIFTALDKLQMEMRDELTPRLSSSYDADIEFIVSCHDWAVAQMAHISNGTGQQDYLLQTLTDRTIHIINKMKELK